MSKFADTTKLCHRARNPNDTMVLQEDIYKLIEWANKWHMNLNVDKCSVMYIGHNSLQGNYNMSDQQFPTTDQQRDLGIIITKHLKWQKQTAAKQITGSFGSLPAISGTKTRTDPLTIQIPSSSTSGI